jgi:hypothetical protein
MTLQSYEIHDVAYDVNVKQLTSTASCIDIPAKSPIGIIGRKSKFQSN